MCWPSPSSRAPVEDILVCPVLVGQLELAHEGHNKSSPCLCMPGGLLGRVQSSVRQCLRFDRIRHSGTCPKCAVKYGEYRGAYQGTWSSVRVHLGLRVVAICLYRMHSYGILTSTYSVLTRSPVSWPHHSKPPVHLLSI